MAAKLERLSHHRIPGYLEEDTVNTGCKEIVIALKEFKRNRFGRYGLMHQEGGTPFYCSGQER